MTGHSFAISGRVFKIQKTSRLVERPLSWNMSAFQGQRHRNSHAI